MSRRKPLPHELVGEAFLTGTAVDAGLGWGVLRGPSVARVSRGLYLDGGTPLTTRSLLATYLRVLPRAAPSSMASVRCSCGASRSAPYCRPAT